MFWCSSYFVVYRVRRNRRELFITTEGIVRTKFPLPIIVIYGYNGELITLHLRLQPD